MKNVRFSRNGVEFEPTKQELKIVLDDFAKQLGEKDKRIAELEAKFAEKEKEIEELRFNERNIFPLVKNLEQKVEQDKTDFAIEQIQKAWDMFSKEYFANEKMETLGTRFLASLDQQIKELKGVKK